MNITLTGRIPSKKNSRNLFVRGGKIMNIPSDAYRKWHKDACKQLLQFEKPRIPFENASVKMVIYSPDLRPADLSNKAESILDLLVDNGFIKDDNWFVVSFVSCRFGGVDRENPRAEIIIAI